MRGRARPSNPNVIITKISSHHLTCVGGVPQWLGMKTQKIRSGYSFSSVFLIIFSGASLNASIIKEAEYQLGEPGSVGAAQPFTALVDDIGGDNSILNWNTDPTRTSIITTGLAAPGSTAALQISNNAGGPGTWYNSSFNGGAGLSDNWAFDLWVRPDAITGTYLGATDGNGGTLVGLRIWATNSTQGGTSLGGKVMGTGSTRLLLSNSTGFLGDATSVYTPGTWARVTIIRQNGTVNYYLDEVLQDSAATVGLVNDIRLGAGYWAEAGSNAAYDQMSVWTFDAADDLPSIEQAVFRGVPEPSSLGLLLLGGLALARRRGKR